MARYSYIKVGRPLNVEDLKKKPPRPGRKPSPRDEDLVKLVNEVSAGSASEVLPWEYEGKPAAARLAAKRIVKQLGAQVYVSSRRDYPGVLLFSRVPLSARQGRKP